MSFNVFHLHKSSGFTLIETLAALAVYAVLIGTLVVVNRSGLENLSELESRALARRALTNVITEFRQQARLGKISSHIGRHNGQYAMAHSNYHWEIRLSKSQNQLTQILNADIRRNDSHDILATIQEVW